MSESYTRFRDISVSERILNTVFLLTAGFGYPVALSNLYYTHQGRVGIGIAYWLCCGGVSNLVYAMDD
jgi:hypothetical protein